MAEYTKSSNRNNTRSKWIRGTAVDTKADGQTYYQAVDANGDDLFIEEGSRLGRVSMNAVQAAAGLMVVGGLSLTPGAFAAEITIGSTNLIPNGAFVHQSNIPIVSANKYVTLGPVDSTIGDIIAIDIELVEI